jgi:glycosyltransferase involved in cell wall biosynthesis
VKVLYFHNYYKYRGGEDISYELDVAMLRDHGHEVVEVTRNNKDIDGRSMLSVAAQTVWNRKTYHETKAAVRQHEPDIVHCNNLFPQFSTSVLYAANKMNVPVVQALRNYRAFCSNAYFYRNSEICDLCHKRLVAIPAIKNACYRDSRLGSAVVATMQTVQKLTRRCNEVVDAYVTPSQFSRKVHVEGGLPADRIFVRPNFVHPDPGIGDGAGNYAIYVGRLSAEKGIGTILKAWGNDNITKRLLIVGTGPLETSIRNHAATTKNIEVIGECSQPKVFELIGDASFLIMASEWYETFGRTIAEAFAKGTPVIVSRLGAMAELVTDSVNGLLFQPGNAADLANCVSRMSNEFMDTHKMRIAARNTYVSLFAREASYRTLIDIYKTVANR